MKFELFKGGGDSLDGAQACPVGQRDQAEIILTGDDLLEVFPLFDCRIQDFQLGTKAAQKVLQVLFCSIKH